MLRNWIMGMGLVALKKVTKMSTMKVMMMEMFKHMNMFHLS